MLQEKPGGPQILCALVEQRRLGAARRVGAIVQRLEPDARPDEFAMSHYFGVFVEARVDRS